MKDFINKAREVHGDKYDYSRAKVVDVSTKVEIICSIHGSFWQLPGNHVYRKSICPKCSTAERGLRRRGNIDNFINKAREVHGDKYDYSKVIYSKSNTKVEIICPEHGSFWQTPNNHTSAQQGCSKCGILSNANNNRLTTADFIEKSFKSHGKKYDYSNVNYTNNNTKVEIICPEHGSFWQLPATHMLGSGCFKCGIDKRVKTLDEFICEAVNVHGDRYDYSRSSYEHSMKKIPILCKQHGEFWTSPSSHVNDRTGCPKCAGLVSGVETDILEWIKSIYGGDVERGNRTIINPYELDIFIPEYNLAIEVCGVYWHSEKFKIDKKYHFNKFKTCEQKGVQLLTVYDSEWLDNCKQQIIKSMIANKLYLTQNIIYARKCIIKEVCSRVANKFYEDNHIQGKTARNLLNVGLFDGDRLVACMTIGMHPRSNVKTLSRYATIRNTNVIGGASKLLKYCKGEYSSLLSWSDNRWSNGGLYKTLGFSLVGDVNPGYVYTKGQMIYSAISMQKKRIGCPANTKEHEFLRDQQYYRLWDCGKKRWKI